MTKYSILLPTRNGGAQLRGCIASVLCEPDEDFELIVSDNASDSETVAVRALKRLPSHIFKPPFPDFYGLTALLITADTWAATDDRLVVIGVSPKSYGRTVHDARQQEAGRSYLGIAPAFKGWLPGSDIINGTYEVLLELLRDFPQELSTTSIDREAYVSSQVGSWITQYRAGHLSHHELAHRIGLLTISDIGLVAKRSASVTRILRNARNVADRTRRSDAGAAVTGTTLTIDEFAKWYRQRDAE